MVAAEPLGIQPPGSAFIAEEVACAHCGLPVPLAKIEFQQPKQFCCEGCRSVHAVLHAAGLDDFYRYQSSSDGIRSLSRSSKRKFEELDDPAFQAQHCRALAEGVSSTEFFLEGVHCSACVWLLERVSRVAPAVLESRFDLTRSVLQVTWRTAASSLSAVARALDSLGYCPHPTSSANLAEERRKGDRALLLRLGIAGAAAGNVMLLSLALYSGKFSGMGSEYLALFRWGSLLIATPTVFWTGNVFLRGGLAALRTRTPHMDLPVSLGILTGYLGSAINTVRARGDIYFDSLCTLIFLLLVGRYLQRTHQRRSSRASELISALAPTTARLVDGESLREVPASAVLPGSIVQVLPGERIAVDGVITEGASSLDTSLLTGESLPQEVTVGDRVYAGTKNHAATLRLRVESSGTETRLGQLMQCVEITQRERAPIVRLADRVAGYFVIAIVGIAVGTLLLWLRLDPSHAIDHTVALLVVTCPCALGMATPLAVSAALRRAAASGILFKGGEFIEELARPGLIVFDKTGTLTEGRLDLVAWNGDESVKPLVRAAEAASDHPIARAIQRAIADDSRACSERVDVAGGMRAQVSGDCVTVGSHAMMIRELGSVPAWVHCLVRMHATAGRTPVVVAVNGEVRALAAFADTVRVDAAASLRKLLALGFQLEVLSGDHQRVVDAIVNELGVPFVNATGGASPESKLSAIARLRAGGQRVFMVGDGVNDAAAMAAANVGIAVHGGAEACLAAADVFTTRAGLEPVALAAEGSRRTVRVIRTGIVLSLAYNVIGIALAVTGRLDPLLAAVLMPVSSISVVTLALRARTFNKKEHHEHHLSHPPDNADDMRGSGRSLRMGDPLRSVR
jgi:P-type Cu2+ transporter